MHSKSLHLLLLLVATPTIAFENGVERGGGEVVEINNRPVLRDLVGDAECTWMRPEQIRSSVQGYDKIIAHLAQSYDLFAGALEQELKSLRFCLSASPLRPLPAEEQRGVAVFEYNALQVAIRVNRDVYLDANIFARLDDWNRSFLLFHEVLHGFIPWDLEQRTLKLRSFVSHIESSMRRSAPYPRAEFRFLIEASGIELKSHAGANLVEHLDSLSEIMACSIQKNGFVPSDSLNSGDTITLLQREVFSWEQSFNPLRLSALNVPLYGGGFIRRSIESSGGYRWVFESVRYPGIQAILQTPSESVRQLQRGFEAQLMIVAPPGEGFFKSTLFYNLKCQRI